MLSCLGTKAVQNLLLSCQEVLGFLLRDDSVTNGAADEEVAVTVILLEEVLTGIAFSCYLDTSTADRAAALQITGRKCQLYFSVFDNELTPKRLTILVAHLKLACLTGFKECLYVILCDECSMILSEHDELTVVPRSVVILL